MRVDTVFNGVLTAPFLEGDKTITTAPAITTLNLAIGEWWYGEITDTLCKYVIKVSNTDKGYIIEQGVCETSVCDSAIGACLDTYCCGELCDKLEEEREKCCLKEIISTDHDVTPDPDDCSIVEIKIKDGVIPEIPEFCFLQAGNLVATITPASTLFFCENGEKFGITFNQLCTALAACSPANTIIDQTITEQVLPEGDSKDLCGMVIEDGLIKSVPNDWCAQFATGQDLIDAIAAINAGVLSVGVGDGLVNNGDSVNPVINLPEITVAPRCFFNGALCVDKFGRVTSGNANNPFGSVLTSGDHITINGGAINHNAPGPIFQTLSNGLRIDEFGHVIGEEFISRQARWCGNPSTTTEVKAVNVNALPNGTNIDFTFAPAMPDGDWVIFATNDAGNPVPLGITARSAAGFTIPNTVGQMCFVVVS